MNAKLIKFGALTPSLLFAAGLLLQGAALAQEPPEAVYRKLHNAALSGNMKAMLSYATEARRAELESSAGAPEVMKLIAAMMPRSYRVTGTAFSPDGAGAVLSATGQSRVPGENAPMYGTVNFRKEKGEWKVDRWEWSSDKPSAPAAAVVPAPAPPAKPAPVQSLPPAATTARPECVIKPVMTDEDLKLCGATPQ